MASTTTEHHAHFLGIVNSQDIRTRSDRRTTNPPLFPKLVELRKRSALEAVIEFRAATMRL